MAQNLINTPPRRGGVDEEDSGGKIIGVSQPWTAFFQQVFTICFAAAQSGTTAQRPDELLWVGRPYFDTTLGLPIWFDGADWIDAAGNVV